MLLSLYKIITNLCMLPAQALGLPQHACRFVPTCSEYCHQAAHTFGLFKGGWLCLRRLIRCRPGTPPGYDPLPS